MVGAEFSVGVRVLEIGLGIKAIRVRSRVVGLEACCCRPRMALLFRRDIAY